MAAAGIGPIGPRRLTVACCLAVWTATIVAFAPVVGNELVNWDDVQTLVVNDRYRGFDWDRLGWMFTTNLGGHYQPLTWLSFALDVKLWGGVSPLGLHFTNVALHMLAATVFWSVALHLIRLIHPRGDPAGRHFGATVAAMLFAIHPLRVESVAWATERRDVLSGLFLATAVLVYLRVHAAGSVREARAKLAVSLVFYVLSLLSKASGFVLPVVLLILDVYPLRRISRDRTGGLRPGVTRVLGEKIIYALPAAAFALLAIRAQSGSGALWSLQSHPLLVRIGQAFYGILFYLGKTVWPFGLVPLYEQPLEASPMDPMYGASALGVLGISAGLVAARNRWPGLLCAWTSYIVLLAPVLGLAQSGPQLVADRYSYLSCVPWAVLAGWVVAGLWGKRWRAKRLARAVLATACLGLLMVGVTLTRAQVRVWKNSQTLWTTTIARRPDTGLAHTNLAAVYFERGQFEQARRQAERALSLLPGNLSAHRIVGQSALAQGDVVAAESHLRLARDRAAAAGKTDARALVALAELLVRQDRFEEAEGVYRELVAAEPGAAQWHLVLGGFLASRGRLEQARTSLQQAAELNPSMAEAHRRLGIVHRLLGDPAAAIRRLERAEEIAPGDVGARAELAWILATTRDDTLRDGRRAATLAESAVNDSQGRSVRAREAYAAALAETGAFAEAHGVIRALLADETIALSEPTRARLEDQLSAYRGVRPTRE